MARDKDKAKTKDTATVAEKNRRIRKESLREQLASGGHLQHVIDIARRLSDENIELDSLMVQRLKAAADIKCKLLAKYIPDVKAIEVTGEDGKPVNMVQTIRIVAANGSDG